MLKLGPRSVSTSTSNAMPRSDAYPTGHLSEPEGLQNTLNRRPIFTQDTVRTLRRWYTANQHHPYPNQDEKEALCVLTGLKMTQVTTWFANARRRTNHYTQSLQRHVSAVSTCHQWPEDIQSEAPAVISDVTVRPGTPAIFDSMDPFQRWANSPPEDEPADAMAIRRATNERFYSWNTPFDHNGEACSKSASDSSCLRHYDNCSSQESCGSSGSSSFSMSSLSLEASHSHHVSHRYRGRRRRRRRRHHNDQHLCSSRSTLVRSFRKIFQCTFCAEEFCTKYDWQRHEKTWHISVDRWVCALTGPFLSLNDGSNTLRCVFCHWQNPDAAHLEQHNFLLCSQRTAEDRTFYRRDHLFQHLRLVHRADGIPKTDFDMWKIPSPQIRSRCGFCGQRLNDWLTRVEHLAQHFKTGCTMAEWVGDWGFDSAILSTIENSMPPCEWPKNARWLQEQKMLTN